MLNFLAIKQEFSPLNKQKKFLRRDFCVIINSKVGASGVVLFFKGFLLAA